MHEMNIAALDLNLLPVFEALLEERSVSAAAKRIGLSQPAMSHALARLRETFSDVLFERRADGLHPTAKAKAIAPQVRAALAAARTALLGEAPFDPRASSRSFRVAWSDATEWLLLPKLLAGLRAPGVRIQARRLESLFEAPEADLRAGALDLAVGYFADARVLGPDLLSETLFEEENFLIMRNTHPRLAEEMDLKCFLSHEHAAIILRQEPWGLIDKELASVGLKRKLRYTSTQFVSVLRAVAESDLVACVPERLAVEFSPRLQLAAFRVPLKLPKFATRAVWKRQAPEDGGLAWLRERMKQAIPPYKKPTGKKTW